MAALPLEAAHIVTAMPEPAALSCNGDPLRPEAERIAAARARSRSHALDLSRLRAYDAVLDILQVYKLSGNFHGNLDTVPRDMGVFDTVTYRVEPNHVLDFSDCRHVVFTGDEHLPDAVFDGIMASIKTRIGFDAPWWVRQLRQLRPRPYGQNKCAAAIIENA
jgi:hypothetical protein